MTFAVSDMPINVLPWKAWSNATTAARSVAFRAILTAFSTASTPELANIVFTGPSIGTSALSRSASSMYGSFAVTWKQVCVSSSSCRWAAATTSGAVCPTFRTEMPVARSIRRLPSTSSTIAPDARAVTIGWMLATPGGMAAARRSNRARLLGPGTSVTSLRSCGMSMDTVCRSGRPESPRSPRAGCRRLGVTDHVDHAEPGLALEPVGEVEAQPPRWAGRQRGEHDRVERFAAKEDILDGEGGVGVAHLAVHVGIERRESGERLLEPGRRDRPRLGLRPCAVPRRLGRDDDVERASIVSRELAELLEQMGARQRPVRDHQVPVHRITSRLTPMVGPARPRVKPGRCLRPLPAAAACRWCRWARKRDTSCSERSRSPGGPEG